MDITGQAQYCNNRMFNLLAGDPVPFALSPRAANACSLDAAVKAAADMVHHSMQSILLRLGISLYTLLAGDPVPFALSPRATNERSLDAAVKAAAEVLNKAVKPVLVGGVKMRWPGKAQDAFLNLAESGHYPVAMQPSAKGFFPESHDR